MIKAAAEAARETGYLSDTQEVRVLLGEGAGYELKIDGNGLVVNEYTGIAEVNGSLKGGEVFETHRSGDTFEGGDHEVSREYITGAGSVEDTGNRIGEIQGSYIGDTLEDYHDVEVGSEDALDYHDVEVDSTEAHLEGGYVGKELPDYKSFFSENRKYNSLPGVRGLDGTYLSQKSLSSQFNKIVIPQEIINLFQNPARISTFVRFDDRVLEVLGLELNNLPGKDKLDVFKMKGTNEGVSWKDIYEKVDLSKVKRAIENLKS